jgi:exodeoxyribonuclease-3
MPGMDFSAEKSGRMMKTVKVIKIASFNANSIRARLGTVIDWLKKESPDVLCLQETKVLDDDFPGKAFEDMHYHSAFRGEKSYNGVAMVSKKPLEDVRIGIR